MKGIMYSSTNHKELKNRKRKAIYHDLLRISTDGKLKREIFTELSRKYRVGPKTFKNLEDNDIHEDRDMSNRRQN